MGRYATIHSLLWFGTHDCIKTSPITDTNGADKIFRGIYACKSGPWGGPFQELFLIIGCLIMGPTA